MLTRFKNLLLNWHSRTYKIDFNQETRSIIIWFSRYRSREILEAPGGWAICTVAGHFTYNSKEKPRLRTGADSRGTWRRADWWRRLSSGGARVYGKRRQHRHERGVAVSRLGPLRMARSEGQEDAYHMGDLYIFGPPRPKNKEKKKGPLFSLESCSQICKIGTRKMWWSVYDIWMRAVAQPKILVWGEWVDILGKL